MTPTLRWSLLVVGESLLLLFLLMYGLTYTESALFHRIHIGILATLGGLGWAVVLARPRLLPSLLVVAPLPLLLSLALTSVISPYPSLSWFATWQCAAYVGIGWLLAVQAGHPTGRRNLIASIGIVGTIVIVAYLLEVAIAWAEWLSFGFPLSSVPLRPGYSGGLVAIPAWLADVVVLSIPAVAVALWIARMRVLAIVLAIAGLSAIVLSGTRSVLLLVTAAAVAVLAIVILGRGSGRTKALSSLGLIGVVALGVGVVAVAGRSFDLGRSSSYATAIDAFASSPLVGTGPGTYGVYRLGEVVDSLYNLAQPDSLNVVLTAASDSGIVGLLGLVLSALAFAIAIGRSWRVAPTDRPMTAAATLSVLVIAGHAMGEVVFGLIGVVVLLLAALAVAVSPGASHRGPADSRPWWAWAGLASGLVVLVVSSAAVVRGEVAHDAITRANAALASAPAAALGAAREATDLSPDSVPAWWTRMVAADASGDTVDALKAARRIVDLEGFAQEWLQLGVLEARAGNPEAARDAIDRAVALGPPDAFVDLNAAILYEAMGAQEQAKDNVRRLLLVRPDIEPLLRAQLPDLWRFAAVQRSQVANDAMRLGDVQSAMLIALSGEDRELASGLVRRVGATKSDAAEYWRRIVDAWFGDQNARTSHDTMTLDQPDYGLFTWSWRFAVRACDWVYTDKLDRAGAISTWGMSVPIALGTAPSFQVSELPERYPGVIWRMPLPRRPYVAGIWSLAFGRPTCAAVSRGHDGRQRAASLAAPGIFPITRPG